MLSTVEMAKRQWSLQVGRCPECDSSGLVVDRDRGEVVCSECGLVIEDMMPDQRSEWREFALEEENAKSRTVRAS